MELWGISEADVALTDFALAIECLVFAYLYARQSFSNQQIRLKFILFFLILTATSLIGGIFHGFFNQPSHSLYAPLWQATMVLIGLLAFSVWLLAAEIHAAKIKPVIHLLAGILLLLHMGLLFFYSQQFWVGIISYLPATLYLLIAFISQYRQTNNKLFLYGISGVVLTLLAPIVQQLQINLSQYVTYNAVYHLIQMVALALLFCSGRYYYRHNP